ncbi:hypothetical protein AAG906_036760 [Vitis piasezkii]|uniref:protein trichome birefringence-like 8 n=1 Tax=Vitis vinifera TaxID=29760 RepID=UPI0005400322|nr:protein trichome birefringence-like 8 [Vitis vinifera]|eukprot:XP_010654124.1 PREDICTED: protein trichome birefringence-like 8 [Vitis vinifera]
MDRRPFYQPISHKFHVIVSPIIINKELTFIISFIVMLTSSIIFFYNVSPSTPFSTYFLAKIVPSYQKSAPGVCDYSNGRWVRDDSYWVGSYNESCPFIDAGFRCRENGRRDLGYLKWRWQPHGCDLPRFNATDLMERSRNGRIVFVGDSIGRNQWESLLCMLTTAVSNQSAIYEVNGNPITKHRGYLSFRFQDYNLTIEYYRAPFLVYNGPPPENSSDKVRSAIKLDQLHGRSKQWTGANVLVFNAGHWWSEDKTTKMGFYFQEGEALNMTMDAMEAFRKSLWTWKSWATQKLDPERSNIFFRSYSPVHYRDGKWNGGGHCDLITEPETNDTKLEAEPLNNVFISEVVKQMEYENRNVQLLNITYLTGFRKDGHPANNREPGIGDSAFQDCSHWCLPGVPDTWNELLYARLLSMGFRTK